MYTSAIIDPLYTDPEYVLTTPPAAGQWLPNSPRHQLSAELDCSLLKKIRIIFGTELQSKWAIYTDANAYLGLPDDSIYKNWQKGFNLFNASFIYDLKLGPINC